MQNLFILLFLAFCAVSCTRYAPEIEAVLQQAGSNRSELEQVLAHYSRHPADSLQLRAAEFLIIHMPGKYSEYWDAPWNDVATVSLRWTSSSDKQRVLGAYGIGEFVKQDDVTHITAEFLIENIDLAFEAWQKRPWGKHISFDAFCEEILPYRVSTEKLENWRRKALASFADLDSMLNKPATTAVDACIKINALLPRFRMDKDFPPMNFTQAMASTRGPCSNMAAMAMFAMRAQGIPVTLESTPRWTFHPSGHNWNTVRDSAGNHISFMGCQSNPGKPHQGNTDLKAKAYRHTFCSRKNILTADEHIPPMLREHANMEDITAEHHNIHSATVHLKYPAATPTGYVYLALENNLEWFPVAWAKVEGDSAKFPNIGKNNIYRPIYYANGRQTAAGDPFWLDGGGRIALFNPDSPDTLLTFHEMNFRAEPESGKIHAGQEYELFYWKQDGWKSLGKQRTAGTALSWNAPSQALFQIENTTKKTKSRAFYIAANCQISWRAPHNHTVRCKRVRTSDVRNNVPAEQGKNAIDGKIDGNRWVAAGSGAHWIELDFEQSSLITGFRFITGNSQGRPQSEYETKKFEFQAWNGSDWTTLVSETRNEVHNYETSFIPRRTSRVRLVTYGDTRLIEIEVYAKK